MGVFCKLPKNKFHESYVFYYILTFVGGYLGAYSYVLHDGVFASAQTGNLILLGIEFANGNYTDWYKYILPIMAFSFGIVVAEYIGKRKCFVKLKSSQMVLYIEAAVLSLVLVMPSSEMDFIANITIAVAAALQTQSFRCIGGHAHFTTMCTGNIRSISEYAYNAFTKSDSNSIIVLILRLGIIISFTVGVVIGVVICDLIGFNSMIVAIIILVLLGLTYSFVSELE